MLFALRLEAASKQQHHSLRTALGKPLGEPALIDLVMTFNLSFSAQQKPALRCAALTKFATRNTCITSSNKCLTSSNKKAITIKLILNSKHCYY